MSADAQAPARESAGCVVGIAFGLVLLGALIAWVAWPKSQVRDGARLLAAWFPGSALPAGYEVRQAARLVPPPQPPLIDWSWIKSGDDAVLLVRAGAPHEPEPPPPTPPAPNAPPPRVDWAAVVVGAADQPPRSLLLVASTDAGRKSELRRLFSAELQPGRLQDIGPMGGRLLLRTGTLRWDGEDRAFVLEREFERGGTFRDLARVDLSNPERALVVKADWARSEPFSQASLEAALAGFATP